MIASISANNIPPLPRTSPPRVEAIPLPRAAEAEAARSAASLACSSFLIRSSSSRRRASSRSILASSSLARSSAIRASSCGFFGSDATSGQPTISNHGGKKRKVVIIGLQWVAVEKYVEQRTADAPSQVGSSRSRLLCSVCPRIATYLSRSCLVRSTFVTSIYSARSSY